MIIKTPGWYRTLYVSSFLACLLAGMVAVFAFHNTTATVFGGTALLLAAVLFPIAVMSLTRRLELRDGWLYSVLITGTSGVAVSEIASIRLSPVGNGMSRCGFVRRGGTAVFGTTRRVWPTADLLNLAKAMNIDEH